MALVKFWEDAPFTQRACVGNNGSRYATVTQNGYGVTTHVSLEAKIIATSATNSGVITVVIIETDANFYERITEGVFNDHYAWRDLRDVLEPAGVCSTVINELSAAQEDSLDEDTTKYVFRFWENSTGTSNIDKCANLLLLDCTDTHGLCEDQLEVESRYMTPDGFMRWNYLYGE